MYRICFCVMVLAFGAGCQESPPEVYKAFGTITLNGEPLEGAMITFLPEDPNLKPATGRSDQLGNFKLTTNEASDGAMEGKFKVRVTKIVAPPAPIGPYDPGFEEWAAEQEAAQKRGEKTGLEPANMLPEKYASADTTDIVYEILAQEENSIELKLEGEAEGESGSSQEEQAPEEAKSEG